MNASLPDPARDCTYIGPPAPPPPPLVLIKRGVMRALAERVTTARRGVGSGGLRDRRQRHFGPEGTRARPIAEGLAEDPRHAVPKVKGLRAQVTIQLPPRSAVRSKAR